MAWYNISMGMENQDLTISNYNPPEQPKQSKDDSNDMRKFAIIGVIVLIIFLLLIAAAIYGLTRNAAVTANIRDIFIIFMAFMTLLLGIVLIILILQLARLINLLQNEIKPILESTNETVSTLRGTTEFISDNLVQPVIKLNEYVAALQQMLMLIGLTRKKKKEQK